VNFYLGTKAALENVPRSSNALDVAQAFGVRLSSAAFEIRLVASSEENASLRRKQNIEASLRRLLRLLC
jgi:hypothetical protein